MPSDAADDLAAAPRFVTVDPVTGALNERGLLDQLATALALARRTSGSVALVRFDVAGVDEVAAELGAGAARTAEAAIAQRLRGNAREHDLVARVAPQAFAVVLQALDGAPPEDVARRLAGELRRPLRIGDHELRCDVRVGVASYPADGEDGLELRAAADTAVTAARPGTRPAADDASAAAAPGA